MRTKKTLLTYKVICTLSQVQRERAEERSSTEIDLEISVFAVFKKWWGSKWCQLTPLLNLRRSHFMTQKQWLYIFNSVLLFVFTLQQKSSTSSTNSSQEGRGGNQDGKSGQPQALDELLERQWEQGSQFLMDQASHFDSKYPIVVVIQSFQREI